MNVQVPAIVVGVDGSPEAMLAAEWAAQEAHRRELPLLLIHAFTDPAAGYLSGYVVPQELLDALQNASRHVLDETADRIRARFPDVPVNTDSVHRDPRRALVDASTDAVLTVVGTRGRGKIPEVIIGSVALYVASHANTPVAVIPPTTDISDGAPAGPVLLGVAGSADSETAVAFAFDEAAVRHTYLLAVLVWDDLALSGFAEGAGETRSVEEDEEHVVLSEQLAGFADKYPDVPTRQIVLRGDPAGRLLSYAGGLPTGHRPSVVVIGSRSRGRAARALLAANSQQVIGTSLDPVIVVRGDGKP
jgi:nucleotide-binding universal stress UspA family protein